MESLIRAFGSPSQSDVQAKLSRIAATRGRDAEALARESIERFVDYDEWFIDEVEKGLVSGDRGWTAKP